MARKAKKIDIFEDKPLDIIDIRRATLEEMAEKKDTEKKFAYNNEVTGIILILISIIGICRYGPVGRFISSFAVFLVGTIYPVLLIMLLLLGLYLIVKRETPDYFSSKLLGLYTFILALLIFLHSF